jgi:hypothetical protein
VSNERDKQAGSMSDKHVGQSPSAIRRARSTTYPSFAVIEIFAFNTFDTGQPFSAASAYF